MPGPLLLIPVGIAAAAAAAAGVAAAKEFANVQLRRQLAKHRPEIEKWAMENALDAMGLPNLMDENLTRGSFTRALNTGLLAGTGVELTNVFDRDAVRKDFERLAVKKVAESMGLQVDGLTPLQLREAFRGWVSQQVREQIEAMNSGGEIPDVMQEAKDLAAVLRVIRAVKTELDANGQPVRPGHKPLLQTPEAIKNRERQARFRASHTKHWEPKGVNDESGGH